MKLSELRAHLSAAPALHFALPSGERLPAHLHVSELGLTSRRWLDCGGALRTDERAVLQLWDGGDVPHRLPPGKLLAIIAESCARLGVDGDPEVAVELQGRTVERYDLRADGDGLQLVDTEVECAAPERCLVPAAAVSLPLSTAQPANACVPGSGCCG